MMPLCDALWLRLLPLAYTPGGWDPLYALLGIVLGPVTIWQCLQSLRSGEGEFDRELASGMRIGAALVLLAGAAVTLGAAALISLKLKL